MKNPNISASVHPDFAGGTATEPTELSNDQLENVAGGKARNPCLAFDGNSDTEMARSVTGEQRMKGIGEQKIK